MKLERDSEAISELKTKLEDSKKDLVKKILGILNQVEKAPDFADLNAEIDLGLESAEFLLNNNLLNDEEMEDSN